MTTREHKHTATTQTLTQLQSCVEHGFVTKLFEYLTLQVSKLSDSVWFSSRWLRREECS